MQHSAISKGLAAARNPILRSICDLCGPVKMCLLVLFLFQTVVRAMTIYVNTWPLCNCFLSGAPINQTSPEGCKLFQRQQIKNAALFAVFPLMNSCGQCPWFNYYVHDLGQVKFFVLQSLYTVRQRAYLIDLWT